MENTKQKKEAIRGVHSLATRPQLQQTPPARSRKAAFQPLAGAECHLRKPTIRPHKQASCTHFLLPSLFLICSEKIWLLAWVNSCFRRVGSCRACSCFGGKLPAQHLMQFGSPSDSCPTFLSMESVTRPTGPDSSLERFVVWRGKNCIRRYSEQQGEEEEKCSSVVTYCG